MSTPSTTVVVADDHPVFRDGLVGLLTDLGAERRRDSRRR